MSRTELFDRTKIAFDSEMANRIFKIVAVLSLIAAGFIGIKQAELTSCLADWNDVNNRIQSGRSVAADSDRQALDDMVGAIANSRDLPAASVKANIDQALLTYLKRRAFNDGQRAGNPLPGPPSAIC